MSPWFIYGLVISKVGCPAATLGPRVPCTIRITEGWGVALFVFVTMDKTELFPQYVLDLEPALKVAGLTRIYFIDNDSDGDDGNNCVIGREQSNDHCNR